jgi:hypothetical protein
MIKSQVNEDERNGNDSPKIMTTGRGNVVLFTGYSTGMVIKNTIDYQVGWYSQQWNMDDFTDFNGTLTLSNGEPQ